VRFLSFGCPHTIAVCDWLAMRAVGQRTDLLLMENVTDIAEPFEVPVQKHGRLLIIEDAWRVALRAGIESGS
jgi:hypothetical protein